MEEEKKIHVSEIKRLLDQNIISYEQAALIFDCSISAVYQKFWRLKKDLLIRVHLKPTEIERLNKFKIEFEQFIDSLKGRIGGDA